MSRSLDERIPEGYLQYRDAAKYLGISPGQLQVVVRREGVPVHRLPLDVRKRLVAISDLDQLLLPRLIEPDEGIWNGNSNDDAETGDAPYARLDCEPGTGTEH